MAKIGTPVNTPTVAVQQLVALVKTLDLLDIPASELDAVKASLVNLIDALPINYRGAVRSDVKFFALVGGEWWACHEGVEVVDDEKLLGGLRWKAHLENGDDATGIAIIQEWAKADGDGGVDYHWLA